MPACGFDGHSQKLLRDLVKDVRAETNVEYAKIGQCNEDCLYGRATDTDCYPSHIYDRSKMLVLVHAAEQAIELEVGYGFGLAPEHHARSQWGNKCMAGG